MGSIDALLAAGVPPKNLACQQNLYQNSQLHILAHAVGIAALLDKTCYINSAHQYQGQCRTIIKRQNALCNFATPSRQQVLQGQVVHTRIQCPPCTIYLAPFQFVILCNSEYRALPGLATNQLCASSSSAHCVHKWETRQRNSCHCRLKILPPV